MTKDEALKLALEALEMCEVPWTGTLDHNLTEAITAIKQALAAPDLQAELDATNRQVEILSDALAESRREVDALVALARADEREACAKVCEDMAKGYEERNARPEENRDINPEVARIASMTCAFVEDAIRARGNT